MIPSLEGHSLVDGGERHLDARRLEAQGIGRSDVGEEHAAEVVPALMMHDLPPVLMDNEMDASR